ncbi:octanoyltransferase LipM [bacterium BMS3Bbin07]|nr:octanoyltransferase LipM [bacterium BMS3Bbin07]HDH02279.1 lipoate--protein ligase family protein [Nitrospirota bacterium]
MKSTWRYIDTGISDASCNMALDEAIAEMALKGRVPPTLRFYGWAEPSVSLGCFQKSEEIDRGYCEYRGIPIVRRPTGGRAILHGREITYSFASRNAVPPFSEGLLSTYGHLSRAFYTALKSLGIDVEIKNRREKGRILTGSALCFQSVSYGELSINKRKAIGSAQKRWKEGFLQQGSIQMKIDPGLMERVFRNADAGKISLTMTGLTDHLPTLSPDELKEAILNAFEEIFEVRLLPMGLTEEEKALALQFQKQKYQSPEWTYCR